MSVRVSDESADAWVLLTAVKVAGRQDMVTTAMAFMCCPSFLVLSAVTKLFCAMLMFVSESFLAIWFHSCDALDQY
jgi:hypothetical protein